MRHIVRHVSIVAALALSSVGTAFAENPLCDREIEGVTVKMSVEEARAIWLARGFVEITQTNYNETRSIASGAIQRVDFADRQPQVNEGYRPERVTLMLMITDLEVTLTKLFHDESGSVSRARIDEFCPNGGPARGGKLACLGVRNGAPSVGRLNISVDPEDPQTAGRCAYSFSAAGLVNETVRLSRQAAPTSGVNAYGIPLPNRTLPARRGGRPMPKRTPPVKRGG